jgi:excisionase family DNA binding protein
MDFPSDSGFRVAGMAGFEPAALASESDEGSVQPVSERHRSSQVGGTIEVGRGDPVQRSQPAAPNTRPFVTRLLPENGPRTGLPTAPLRPLSRPFLAVRQVAEMLSISTATVYALVKRGAIPHVRVSNAIRFDHQAVAEFVVASRGR